MAMTLAAGPRRWPQALEVGVPHLFPLHTIGNRVGAGLFGCLRHLSIFFSSGFGMGRIVLACRGLLPDLGVGRAARCLVTDCDLGFGVAVGSVRAFVFICFATAFLRFFSFLLAVTSTSIAARTAFRAFFSLELPALASVSAASAARRVRLASSSLPSAFLSSAAAFTSSLAACPDAATDRSDLRVLPIDTSSLSGHGSERSRGHTRDCPASCRSFPGPD
jgi:hypothetical protein